MTHTNLLLETPPSGQICALLRTAENRRQTTKLKRIRLGMDSPHLAETKKNVNVLRERLGASLYGSHELSSCQDWHVTVTARQ
jgi:hypothetical protein